jgi:hemolysin activation/secretion protein
MIRMSRTIHSRVFFPSPARSCGLVLWFVVLLCGTLLSTLRLLAAETAPDDSARFVVHSYKVKGDSKLPESTLASMFSKYTGRNVNLTDIVKAASDLQSECRRAGEPNMTVAVARDRITNGIVTMNVFRARTPHILISGKSFANLNDQGVPAARTAKAKAGPHFTVRAYEIHGDTLLSSNTLMSIFAKKTGTNIGVADIVKAGSELQMEYHDRGYPTVNVTIPPQQITNGIVKIRVFEGRLANIVVTNNHYFSSNNVVRNFPSLRTNTILRGPIFQAELDRANANQDRQIYPQIAPGPKENTSMLILDVKDRLPLHAKVELNNQSSPGTPDLRVNTSAAYNNLRQREDSVGVQYSLSPEAFKQGDQWNFYDEPLVANYSAYYRLTLGSPASVAETVAKNQGRFGYNEATRKFELPSPSGRPELTFYAGRSTIDTGVQESPKQILLDIPFVREISRQDSQQDITINQSAGFRLNEPVLNRTDWRLNWSAGADYKSYTLDSYRTNTVVIKEITVNANNQPNPPTISTISSPTPPTHKPLEYVPVSFHFDANRRYAWGATTLGLGVGGNAWYSGSKSNLQSITSSADSAGHWVVLNPSFSQDVFIRTNWTLSLRADGQWTSEPLISNEQFGEGGVNSVRGYREGEVFGDTGWHVSLELKTPPHVVGIAYGRKLLSIRGSIYMDYAEAYLLDPQSRDASVPLWGTGVGAVASVGSYWEARFLFSWPLLSTVTTPAGQPFFNFSLTAQF